MGLLVIMACFRTAAARVDIVTILIITNKIHFNCGIKISLGIYWNFYLWISKYLTNIKFHNSWEVTDFCWWGKRVVNLPVDVGSQGEEAAWIYLQRNDFNFVLFFSLLMTSEGTEKRKQEQQRRVFYCLCSRGKNWTNTIK